MQDRFRSLVPLLRHCAEESPDRGYTWLAQGEEAAARLTFADLNRRARAIAAALAGAVPPGERALLLYSPGLEFVAAFFGCLQAGVIAVPAYPPRSRRADPRLRGIALDCRPRAVLTTAALLGRAEQIPELASALWLDTETLDDDAHDVERSGEIAFLQYTSGSTGNPKGVVVTHANLLHNEERIRQAFGQTPDSVVVSWLPPYHDMGLIGGLLQPLYVGASCILMPPVAFLQKPLRWLAAISRYRGTTSGGPNFAYDLCVQRVTPAEIESLDLSSWEVAFNGAEPVRTETLRRFAAAFGPCGFRKESFVPCYGLAEATLLVTAGRAGTAADRPVRCGPLPSGDEVAVVDPVSGEPCAAGVEGEIWVRGPSVAAGYWNRPEESRETFGASLADGQGPFLRTGDLGFVTDGELAVSGRLKDLIILRGRNLHPQDLEATARAAHPALAVGMGAAFSVDGGDDAERLVIVHEVERHASRLDEIAAAVRQAIAEVHEVLAWEVVLVPVGGVPRTTSGKVQRRACRDLYAGGELRVLESSRLAPAAADEDLVAAALPGSLDWLRRTFAAVARIEPAGVDPNRPLSALGLDSLAAVELKYRVEEATGVFLPLPDLLEGMTLRDVERQIAEGAPAEPVWACSDEAMGETGEHPLSWNQRSLWFLYRLAPESPAYNIAGAARLHGADAATLGGRALQGLVDRHPMLRATFIDTPDGPVQRVAERADAAFVIVDAAGWSDAEVRERLHTEAFRPFDLSAGPPLRAALLRRGREDLLVLSVHHIVADFWSMTVLARELGALYAGQAPPSPRALYTDFVHRQQQMLEGTVGERLWEHWRERLAGIPQLDLPTDRPRRPVQTLRGGSLGLSPSLERTEAVHRLAATHGCTPFVTLLAAWQAVLSRWSGQEEFLAGTPAAGRSAREWEGVVGYFVNPVPLRCDLAGDPTIGELMARARSTTLDALAHQEFPFALLTERLQPERDLGRPPFIAAMLTFEKAPGPELSPPLAAFAVGVPGARLDLGPLVLESLPLEPPAAQLDLSLIAAELPEGLAAFLQWDADLFDQTTVERMLSHLDRLLTALVEAGRPVSELPLLGEAERDQILLAWSGAETAPAGTGCLHELFEAQVVRTPDATALIAGDLRLAYDELNRRANRLAHHLRRRGVGPEQRVGVSMHRSAELITALLAVLKSGAAYVPLDPGYPADWRSFAAADAKLVLLLTEAAAEEASGDSELDPEPLAGPHNLAYVLYTSGSTGRPKGVAIEHRAPVERMLWARDAFPAADLAGVLAATSVCFDLSVFEIFAPLSWGGTVILADHALALPALPARGGVTLLNTVPSAMAELASGELPPRLRTVNLAGEALEPALAERIYRHPQVGQVLNLYGPTEDATYSTWARVDRGASRVSIGRPLPGTRVYVLDRHLQPVPAGMPGELYLAGAGGARGYLGRPELTAERFLPDCFAAQPGARLYRTGDLARWLAAGELEHLGRVDHQVKVRGFRIELGEIERVLREHPQVQEAVVVVRDSPGGRELAAYVVPGEAGVEELRRHLGGRLPAYMVPSSFQRLPALPRTPNGKLDRKALPAPQRRTAGETHRAPRTPVDEVLRGIWAEVLGREQIGADDHFFDLGGHSLLATRVISRLRGAFGVEIPLRDLFAAPRLADLAVRVEEALRAGTRQQTPPLVPMPREGDLPLSFAQQRLWLIDQLEPGSPLYNMPGALRVEGPLDGAVLALCLGEIVRRHEALRTVFAVSEGGDGAPVQVVRPAQPFLLPVVDLGELPERAREALTLIREEAARPFDLSRGPMLRGVLLRLAEEDHILSLTLHHIASDGWSLGVLVREVAALYPAFTSEKPSPLPELPVQYADFAVWQHSWLQGDVLGHEISFWRRQLAGLPPLLELPTDRPRPAKQSHRGSARPARLPAALTRQTEALARREGATLFMILLAAFQALLARTSGQDDLAVGSPVAGRNRVDIEGLIGFFVNPLVMRGDLSGAPSFRELLGQVRETALAAWLHQDIPFERLVEELSPERSLAHSPLFQVMLALQNAPFGRLEIPGLRLQPVPVEGTTAKLDLTLSLSEHEGGLAGTLEHATDLYDGATVDRLMGHFERLLAAAVSTPDEPVSALSLLSPEERGQILIEWNDTAAAPAPRACLHELFEAQARRTPDAVALVDGERKLLYRELDEDAERLAADLRRRGAGPEVVVGVRLERSAEMVTALLAILKAGSAYLPLDPQLPPARLEALMASARVSLVLDGNSPAATGSGSRGKRKLSGKRPHPENLAYILFTSGSTGTPKGVAVTHQSAVGLVRWAGTVFTKEELAGVLASTSLSFDLSVFEIFAPLSWGGSVILAQSTLALPELPARERVTLVNTVPSAMAELARTGSLGRSIRTVNLAGEPLPRALASQIHATGTVERVYNLYGPSEDTTYSTFSRVARDSTAAPAIGRPITGTRAYVLAGPEAVPVGVAGELHLGGAGLARGYLHRPDLTAERFIPDLFATELGGRLYRTGDLVRWTAAGDLEFLGRTDHQVKIRGFRIEPGEIEAALLAIEGVREAVVTAREDVPGNRRLVAYVVGEVSAETLRQGLRKRLPDYMVPAAFVALESFPLTPNGKVDRKALPAPELPVARESYVAPRTREEELLAAVWAQVLRLPRVGVEDKFFELGGDSILSVQIAAQARQSGLRFTVREIFKHQTVARLARHATVVKPSGAAATGQGPVSGEVPLTPIQRWFFEQGFADPHHFNQALLLESREALDPGALERAMAAIVEHHDALRMRFAREADGWRQENASSEPVSPFSCVDLSGLPAPRSEGAFAHAAAALQAGFDLSGGPLTRLCLFHVSSGGVGHPARLLWVTHHLVVDGVSWRLLLADLESAYRQAERGLHPALPPKATSFQEWSRRLAGHTSSAALAGELETWRETARVPVARLPVDFPETMSLVGDRATVSFKLSAEETADLLQSLPAVYHSRIDDALLSALVRAVWDGTGSPRLRVDLEGHGREPIAGDVDDLDVSRTVGWFTSLYPVVLEAGDAGPGEALVSAKECLRAVPGRGIGYGLLRHRLLPEAPAAEISFNYL
ncbi:MAG TPA: amino acid adenylation domain-containing protein, partial [Thermoanaerobaculia bacterium]|nr:amino acid adenylation domain-containing protein [Thermoanaerobaculia bacterium]